MPIRRLFPYCTILKNLCYKKRRTVKSWGKIQKKVDNDLVLPENTEKYVKFEDKQFSKIIEKYGKTYEGTDPLEDMQRIYKD